VGGKFAQSKRSEMAARIDTRCPRCNTRSLVMDYDDLPESRGRAVMCICCGRRFRLGPVQETAATEQGKDAIALR
jgi:DNA-directed RNA polymerase subunit RPC12/RpoP